MPRRPQPWFRFYTETLHDQKLRGLPPTQRWAWVAILGAARQSPTPGVLLVSERRPLDDRALADLAAMPIRDVRRALQAFESDDMIHRDETSGAWRVTNWAKRQFESDDTTERTRKHRSNGQRRNVPTSLVGTPPETETETDPPFHAPVTHDPPGENGAGAGLIDQALELAARRYGEHQMSAGQGRSIDGLASWWHQENDQGARARATSLLDDHDLSATQLADALLQPNAPWLRNYRRRNSQHPLPTRQETDPWDAA